MHRDIPRLHAILVTKSKHIGELEHMLRETRETASREFERLRAENEKLKQSFQAKLKEKERECEGPVFALAGVSESTDVCFKILYPI